MKIGKNELKEMLRPIVKELIKEEILETNGVVSRLVTEVLKGSQAVVPLREQVNEKPKQPLNESGEKQATREQIREKLVKSLGHDTYKAIYEGQQATKEIPLPDGAQRSEEDPGVNIDGIADLLGDRWQKNLIGKQ
jgi:hypothetical protein